MSTIRIFPILIAGIFLFLTTAAQAASPNSVRGFVYEWFGLFDQNAPVERFLGRLEDDELHIEFPERTLTSFDDFSDWYSGILATYKVATHSVRSVDVRREGSNWNVDLVVLWKAEAFDGSHAEFLAHQRWLILEKADGELRIRRYIVRAAEQQSAVQGRSRPTRFASVTIGSMDTLASSTLSDVGLTCTCHGGPGNYPFACAPIQKTCYGGPGYYPYQCSVCPEG